MSKIPLLIVEGPDCAGKTTLAKFISRHYPATFLHCTYTESLRHGMRDHQVNMLNTALVNIALNGSCVVMDRLWPSQSAYSSVLRTGDDCSWCDTLHQLILGAGGKYIFCMDSEIEKRHANNRNPEHPYSDDDFKSICQNYWEIFDNMHEDHVIRYDMLEHGSDLKSFVGEHLHD